MSTATVPSELRLAPDAPNPSADAQQAAAAPGTRLVLQSADGTRAELPEEFNRVLLAAVRSLTENGSVTIGHVPEVLSSTTAADMLGVSRPTLMKWAKSGRIPSHKVGTHTRFRREDLQEFARQRAAEKRTAFDRLRALEDELEAENS